MIDVQVRSENGSILEHGTHGIEWTQDLIDLDAATFPMLAGLCAYLDTIFNQRQVYQLLDELQRLPTGVIPEPATTEIQRLATKVGEGQHLYLWFCGD
ncbi:hypothetical protein M1L60_08295 [Actinoplanes sp. TRM 88003]|uniref:Uncharacterized protein n=1 Tax=Paractinoplanes aksuensis TaxID=2939490 RepID=A0ABT1DIE4_9ACTN|nr:hypothetical protein [Actinoplanes aksuensis]MCO8270597.1 hypothetical protein [Actinoplanes aksuensis]